MNKNGVTALVWVVAIAWALALVVAGVALPPGFFKPVSGIATTMGTLVLAFDRWAWRWSIWRQWLVRRPNIGGSWLVELASNWIDPSSVQQVPAKGACLVVRQTYSSLSIRLLTDESASKLRAGAIVQEVDGEYEVLGVYLNEPDAAIRERSAIHYGAIRLSLIGSPVAAIDGHYWTDRGTRGTIKSRAHDKRLFGTFAAARTALERPKPTDARVVSRRQRRK